MAAIMRLRRTRNGGAGFAAGCGRRRCGHGSACRLLISYGAVKPIEHDAENDGANGGYERKSTTAQFSEAQSQYRIGLCGFLGR